MSSGIIEKITLILEKRRGREFNLTAKNFNVTSLSSEGAFFKHIKQTNKKSILKLVLDININLDAAFLGISSL